jgi:hypothetical protein
MVTISCIGSSLLKQSYLEKGISQAKFLGVGLSEIHFTAAYSSDSQRVLDTAKYAIGRHILKIKRRDHVILGENCLFFILFYPILNGQ